MQQDTEVYFSHTSFLTFYTFSYVVDERTSSSNRTGPTNTMTEKSKVFIRHGVPLQFYIAPTFSERKTLAPLIEEGGGILQKTLSNEAVVLAPKTLNGMIGSSSLCYDAQFVTDCIAKNERLVGLRGGGLLWRAPRGVWRASALTPGPSETARLHNQVKGGRGM